MSMVGMRQLMGRKKRRKLRRREGSHLSMIGCCMGSNIGRALRLAKGK
jgi:hypothetical protein